VKARLRRSARAALQAHAAAQYPHEACGVLLGRALEKACEVQEAVPCRNINAERAHDRYQIDPKEQLKVEKDARARGLDVLGYFHSHPDHPAAASATDLALSWEDVLYLIQAVDKGRPGDLQAYWRPAGSVDFEKVKIEPA